MLTVGRKERGVLGWFSWSLDGAYETYKVLNPRDNGGDVCEGDDKVLMGSDQGDGWTGRPRIVDIKGMW